MWVDKPNEDYYENCLIGMGRFIPKVENLRLRWSICEVTSPEVLERFQEIYEKLWGNP